MGRVYFKEVEEAKAVLKGLRDSFNSYKDFVTVEGLKGSLALDPDGIKYDEKTPDDSKYGWTWKEIGDVVSVDEIFTSDPDGYRAVISLPDPVKVVKDPDYFIVHLQMQNNDQHQEYNDVLNIRTEDGFLVLDKPSGNLYLNIKYLVWYWFRKKSSSSSGDE